MMSTKTIHWIGLLICLSSDINCVRCQATTDQCRSDDNGGLQTVLLEQTLQKLQAMNERLQAVESRLESVENQHVSNKQWLNSRLESLEQLVKKSDKGTQYVVD